MSQAAHLKNNLMPLSEALSIIQAETEWRRNNEKITFYEPNEPIERFIKLVGEVDGEGKATNLIYILSAANGLGKTAGLVNIAGNLMFGVQNKFFDLPLFKSWPYLKRIRFVSEPSQVEDSGAFPNEVKKWWPKGKYKALRGAKHYNSIYKVGDWELEVLTYEQLAEQHEGQNCGLILFNEPPPEHLWTPNVSRLRNGGIVVVGMTPLTKAGWFFDKVAPRHTEYTVFGDVEKACKTHGVRGHLEHDQIERMIAEYDEDEREARMYGKAMYLQGLIYKTFNTGIHVLKESIEAPANATLYQAVDPHSDKPFACIWAFVDSRQDVYIVDEWPNVDFNKWKNCQLTIKDYAEIFRQKERGHTVHRRIIDRHFADVRSAVNKRTLREELRDIGLEFEPSYKAEEEIETGILRVRDYLKYNPDRPLDSVNRPKLMINPHCQNTIKSFQRWARSPEPDSHGVHKPQDAFKDFSDCVRYLVMSKPEIDVPIPYKAAQKMW